jgi:hypothetical protein
MTQFVSAPADADANPLLGLQVVMASACPECRHRVAVIGPGKGPHTAALTCARCRQHRGWMSIQEADFIKEIIRMFGKPTTPIMLRNPPASGAARCQSGFRSSSSAPGGHRSGR